MCLACLSQQFEPVPYGRFTPIQRYEASPSAAETKEILVLVR